jgi:hypothetical protein
MQSSVPATRGTAAAYAPATPRVPVADCGRSGANKNIWKRRDEH